MTKSRISLLACVFASACAAPANPPSLLPRAIETQSAEAPALSPSTPLVPDSAFMARLDDILASAKKGDAAFGVARNKGAIALSNGQSAAQGSEAWVAAEMARSALEAARQQSADALADIDSLVVTLSEQASRNPGTAGLKEALGLQTEVEAIVDRQTRQLNNIMR